MKYGNAFEIAKGARHWFWVAPLVLGIVFIGAGAYMVTQGRSAQDQVKSSLVLEGVTTSADASIPNVTVESAATAESEDKAIQGHVNKLTGGKTYSQLAKDDPNSKAHKAVEKFANFRPS